MTEFVQAFWRQPDTDIGNRTFKLVAIFCGAGLSVSLLAATYGVDLSPGFF